MVYKNKSFTSKTNPTYLREISGVSFKRRIILLTTPCVIIRTYLFLSEF